MAGAMSSQSSGVTGSDPSDFAEQEEVSNMELSVKEPSSSEWTDEKHSMYLKSMEASFIDQLYSSLDLGGRHSQKKHHYMRSCKPTDCQTPYEFKVHRNGGWQRIKFNRGEPPPQEAEECRALQRNPWIQHFRVGVRENQTSQGDTSIGSQNVSYGGRMALTCGLANISEHSPVCQASQDSNVGEEFSDQNFDEEENEQGGTSSLHIMKRKNTVEAAPSKDQVKRRIGI